MSTVAKGRNVEQWVKQRFIAAGYRFIAQNFYCRRGEIDLIFEDDTDLIFIEVKYRQTNTLGRAEDAFTARKKQRLIKAIHYFMHKNKLNYHHTNHRIDLVAINGKQVTWYKSV